MLGAETLSNKRYTDMGKQSNDDVEEEERIIKNKCWKQEKISNKRHTDMERKKIERRRRRKKNH